MKTNKIRIERVGNETTVYKCEYAEKDGSIIWKPDYIMVGDFDMTIEPDDRDLMYLEKPEWPEGPEMIGESET